MGRCDACGRVVRVTMDQVLFRHLSTTAVKGQNVHRMLCPGSGTVRFRGLPIFAPDGSVYHEKIGEVIP